MKKSLTIKKEIRAKFTRFKELRSKENLTAEEKTELQGLPDIIEERKLDYENEVAAEEFEAGMDDSLIDPPEGGDPEHRGRVVVEDKVVYRSLGQQLQDIVVIGGENITGISITEARKRNMENEKRTRSIIEKGYEPEFRSSDTVSVTDSASGGGLVQTDFAMELVDKGFNNGVIINKCASRTLTSGANSLEVHGIDENSRKDGARFGGIQVFSKREMDQYEASKSKFAMVSMKVDKITGLLKLSDEIIQDAGFLETEISGLFPKAFDFKLQNLILSSGRGDGEPESIMNSKAMITVPKTSGQAAGTITVENISAMKVAASGNAEWYGNRDIIPALEKLYRSFDAGSGVVNITPLFKQTGMNTGTLDGIPITFVEQCETLGTKGDLVLADFGEYLLLRKGGLNKAESMHLYFDQGIKAIRWDIRMDGKSRWKSPLTPFKGGNKISPFVCLATRA